MQKRRARKGKNTARHIKTHKKKILKTEKTPINKDVPWDQKKSMKDNIKNLSSWININQRITEMTNKIEKQEEKVKGIKGPKNNQFANYNNNPTQQYIDVEEIDLNDLKKMQEKRNLPEESYVKKEKQLTIDEQWAVEQIVKNYGENFKKAVLDKKVNSFWWTKDQMKKKHQTYINTFGKCPK